MKKSIILLINFYVVGLYSQPAIQWQKTFGGSSTDESYSIKQTTDGGYILAGKTLSNNGDVFGNHGSLDFWALKLASNGSIQWKKAFGGTGSDVARFIQQTFDGGYILVGHTSSNNFDVSGNHGGLSDGWVIKLSGEGEIQWQKAFGGSAWDEILSAQQTIDNGYILAGKSNSSDGDVSENKGQLDFWVIKLDEVGNLQWQKSLGGSSDEMAKSVKQTSDGGYVIVGETASMDGDVTDLRGNVDYWVVKLSPAGELEWQKVLGGNNADIASDVIQTNDGGYVVVGYVGSGTGDITVFHGLFDFWVVKLSSTGELIWEKTLGGSQPDWARAVVEAPNGGYIIAGTTGSTNGDVVGSNGGAEFWAVKVSETGDLIWQKTYGGTLAEECFALANTMDNGFVLAGYTWSTDGDVSGAPNKGQNDFWVVKLSPEPSTPTTIPLIPQLTLFPNPAETAITIQAPGQGNTLNVSIHDLLGRALLRTEIPNGGQIDIAALPKGVYLVSATDGDGIVWRGKLEKG